MTEHPTIVHVEDTSTPLARIVLHFLGGASQDPAGFEGLTCLMNRLMIRGTRQHARAEYEDLVEQLGVNLVPTCGASSLSIGGSLHRRHASTWFNLIQAAFTMPLFDPEEIERGKRELLAEFDTLFDEDASLGRFFLKQALFKGTPYGRSILGTPESLKRITREGLLAHRHQTYTQHNLLVGCAGDAGGESVQAPLAQLIQSLPTGVPVQLPKFTLSSCSTRVVIIDKPDRAQCQVFSGQLVPGASQATILPYQFGALVLGGTFTSRLIQKLRVERGLSYGAYAWLSTDQMYSGLFTHADVAGDRIDEGVAVLLESLDTLARDGITEAEFDFGKQHILKGMPFGLETASMEAAQKVRLALLGRNIADFDRRVELVNALEIGAVQTAMQSLLTQGSRVILLVCTYDEKTKAKLAPILKPFDIEVIDGR